MPPRTSSFIAVLGLAALAVTACGQGGGKEDKAAYEGCVRDAKKPNSKVANASFAAQDKATFGYMQDSSITVRIPYQLDGKQGTLECSMVKQSDGSYKDQFSS
jgi:hypothetical protein